MDVENTALKLEINNEKIRHLKTQIELNELQAYMQALLPIQRVSETYCSLEFKLNQTQNQLESLISENELLKENYSNSMGQLKTLQNQLYNQEIKLNENERDLQKLKEELNHSMTQYSTTLSRNQILSDESVIAKNVLEHSQEIDSGNNLNNINEKYLIHEQNKNQMGQYVENLVLAQLTATSYQNSYLNVLGSYTKEKSAHLETRHLLDDANEDLINVSAQNKLLIEKIEKDTIFYTLHIESLSAKMLRLERDLHNRQDIYINHIQYYRQSSFTLINIIDNLLDTIITKHLNQRDMHSIISCPHFLQDLFCCINQMNFASENLRHTVLASNYFKPVDLSSIPCQDTYTENVQKLRQISMEIVNLTRYPGYNDESGTLNVYEYFQKALYLIRSRKLATNNSPFTEEPIESIEYTFEREQYPIKLESFRGRIEILEKTLTEKLYEMDSMVENNMKEKLALYQNYQEVVESNLALKRRNQIEDHKHMLDQDDMQVEIENLKHQLANQIEKKDSLELILASALQSTEEFEISDCAYLPNYDLVSTNAPRTDTNSPESIAIELTLKDIIYDKATGFEWDYRDKCSSFRKYGDGSKHPANSNYQDVSSNELRESFASGLLESFLFLHRSIKNNSTNTVMITDQNMNARLQFVSSDFSNMNYACILERLSSLIDENYLNDPILYTFIQDIWNRAIMQMSDNDDPTEDSVKRNILMEKIGKLQERILIDINQPFLTVGSLIGFQSEDSLQHLLNSALASDENLGQMSLSVGDESIIPMLNSPYFMQEIISDTSPDALDRCSSLIQEHESTIQQLKTELLEKNKKERESEKKLLALVTLLESIECKVTISQQVSSKLRKLIQNMEDFVKIIEDSAGSFLNQSIIQVYGDKDVKIRSDTASKVETIFTYGHVKYNNVHYGLKDPHQRSIKAHEEIIEDVELSSESIQVYKRKIESLTAELQCQIDLVSVSSKIIREYELMNTRQEQRLFYAISDIDFLIQELSELKSQTQDLLTTQTEMTARYQLSTEDDQNIALRIKEAFDISTLLSSFIQFVDMNEAKSKEELLMVSEQILVIKNLSHLISKTCEKVFNVTFSSHEPAARLLEVVRFICNSYLETIKVFRQDLAAVKKLSKEQEKEFTHLSESYSRSQKEYIVSATAAYKASITHSRLHEFGKLFMNALLGNEIDQIIYHEVACKQKENGAEVFPVEFYEALESIVEKKKNKGVDKSIQVTISQSTNVSMTKLTDIDLTSRISHADFGLLVEQRSDLMERLQKSESDVHNLTTQVSLYKKMLKLFHEKRRAVSNVQVASDIEYRDFVLMAIQQELSFAMKAPELSKILKAFRHVLKNVCDSSKTLDDGQDIINLVAAMKALFAQMDKNYVGICDFYDNFKSFIDEESDQSLTAAENASEQERIVYMTKFISMWFKMKDTCANLEGDVIKWKNISKQTRLIAINQIDNINTQPKDIDRIFFVREQLNEIFGIYELHANEECDAEDLVIYFKNLFQNLKSTIFELETFKKCVDNGMAKLANILRLDISSQHIKSCFKKIHDSIVEKETSAFQSHKKLGVVAAENTSLRLKIESLINCIDNVKRVQKEERTYYSGISTDAKENSINYDIESSMKDLKNPDEQGNVNSEERLSTLFDHISTSKLSLLGIGKFSHFDSMSSSMDSIQNLPFINEENESSSIKSMRKLTRESLQNTAAIIKNVYEDARKQQKM